MVTFSIFTYFLIFATIIIIVLKDSKIKQKTKYMLATLFFVATIFTHNSISSQQGYATRSNDVPDGNIVAIEVVENIGIFLWVYEKNVSKSLMDYILFKNVIKQPKAYHIEYDKETSKKFQEMKKELQKGYVIQKNDLDTRKKDSSRITTINESQYHIIDPRNLLKKD